MMSFTAGVLRKLAAPIIAQGPGGLAVAGLAAHPRAFSLADVESATVQRPAPGYAGLATECALVPADALALWAFVGPLRSSRSSGSSSASPTRTTTATTR